MTDEPFRALTRLREARERASSPTMTHLRMHPHATIDLYLGVFRDLADLAKLKTTEAGDREALRSHYELKRMELEGELKQIELAIQNDHAAFDALRADNKELVLKLIEMGEVDAAIQLQTRFLQSFGGSTLDKLLAGRKRT
jgi:hypothetical protein